MSSHISEFKGDYRFLSNFWPSKFIWAGMLWQSSECAYQAAKSISVDDWLAIQNMTPAQSKAYGKKVVLRPDWEDIKFCIMCEIVSAKFQQNPQLLQALHATGWAYLEEGNTWGDRIWGVSPPESGNGKNLLGLALMAVRHTTRL